MDRPAIMPGDEFYTRAFHELSTERCDTLAPIPWSKIIQFGERCGLDSGMVEALVIIIRMMDKVWLEWQQKKLRND
jgi:hypothetical protein